VRPEDLQTILEAGRFAPSTVNLQTWSFITFRRSQWHEVFGAPIPFRGACAVLICADIHRLENVLADLRSTPCVNLCFAIFNAGLAAMNMTIAAEALGLKSIMLSETGKTGLLDIAHLRARLGLPEGVLPLTTLVLGQGGPSGPGIPPRQPRAAVVMEGMYNHKAEKNLQDWFQQMLIGFKLTHPLSSFDRQLEMYRKKMIEAEAHVRDRFVSARNP
jgi:nitroreductase